MSIWYIFRGRVSSQNSKLASLLTHKKWDKLFYGTVDLALYSTSICFGEINVIGYIKIRIINSIHISFIL